MTEAAYLPDLPDSDRGAVLDLPGWNISPPIRNLDDLEVWLEENPNPDPDAVSHARPELSVVELAREGWLKRSLRTIGLGLLAASEELSGLSPETVALIRSSQERAEGAAHAEEALRRDRSDLGIYPHEHEDLFFPDTPPGTEPRLT